MNLACSMKNNLPVQKVQAPLQHRGASLIMVMIILTVVSLLGIAGVQISILSERSARNDRDYQLAWQSSEAALIDAEFDIFGPAASTRRLIFSPQANIGAYVDGCGSSGSSIGLCSLVASGKPAWLTVNFETTGASAATTEYGAFTGRAFAAGASGFQPSKRPRYVMEAIPDNFGKGSPCRDVTAGAGCNAFVYRVTAMGFGPRDDIQAVLQMVYRN